MTKLAIISWPAWFYGPAGESGVFERAEDVPEGWKDHPDHNRPAQTEDPAILEAEAAKAHAKAWPAWYYGPGGKGAVFEKAEDVPEGWMDHPNHAIGIPIGWDNTAPVPEVTKPAPPAEKSTLEKSEDFSNEVDAAGWPWTEGMHVPKRTKTKEGLWRMMPGVPRPEPKTAGEPPVLDL